MPPLQSQDIATTPPPTPRPAVTITTTGPDGKTHTLTVPTTRAEIRELTRRREAISSQLTNVSERRSELASEIRNTSDPVSRTGLESRLKLLDQRILLLETDLATTGQQLAAAPAQLVTTTAEERQPPPDDSFEEGVMAGGFSVLVLISAAIYFARRSWKRAVPAGAAKIAPENARLERLEHGMEAIAIEIERISEGQRFVTKLLSESQQAGGGAQRLPQPIAAEPDQTR